MSGTVGSIDQNATVVPIVATDFGDYAPGSTAIFTASGFGDFDPILFQINLVDPTDGSLLPAPAGVASWTVIDDGTGAATTSWYVDQAYANTTIELTTTDIVTGQTASVVFTDHASPPPIPSSGVTITDLTTVAGASATIGDAFFQQASVNSGTGQFPAFLGIQATGQEVGEQGFNTSANSLPYDTSGGSHTGAIQLDSVPLVSYNGTLYRQFLVAVNQSSSTNNANDTQNITLNALKILVSNTGGDTINNVQTDGSGNFAGLDNATQVYDLGNNVVELTSQYSSGNGTSDYVILVPDADFQSAASGLNANPYVYVYANMGGYQGYLADGGFEEFGLGKTAPVGTLVPTAPTYTPNISLSESISASGTVLAGTPLTYTFTVSNTGNEDLTGVVLNDSNLGYVDNIGAIAAGGSITVTDTVAAGVGANGDNATASGTGANDSVPVSSTAGTSYFGADAEISISGSVDGGNGLSILDGTALTYSYTVSDTGNVALSSVTGVGSLDAGASGTFTADGGTAVSGTQTVTQTATGSYTDSLGHTATPSDTTTVTYFGADAEIGIVTTVDGGTGKSILVGKTLGYSYAVTDAGGNVSLSGVTVTDPSAAGISLASGDGGNNLLDTGETWIFNGSGTATAGWHTDTGAATGTFTDSLDQTANPNAQSSATYFGATAGITVDEQVSVDNGNTWTDIGSALNNPNIDALSPVEFKVVVTNTSNGGLAVTGVGVSDADGLFSSLTGATIGANGGSIVATGTVSAALLGHQFDSVTVTGTVTDDAGNQQGVVATDKADYTGVFPTGVTGLSAGYWAQHETIGTKAVWKTTNSGGTPTAFNTGDMGSGTTASGVLLGDKTGGSKLFIPSAAAVQQISSSDSAADTRQILLKQALAAQLNIEAGAKDPGGLPTGGTDLLGDAVKWLSGKPIGVASFIYSAAGNIDTNGTTTASTTGNGVLDISAEYNTNKGAFTSTAMASSNADWTTAQDLGVMSVVASWGGPTSADFKVDGQGIKNALMAFNQNQLVVSGDGNLVGWNGSGAVGGAPSFWAQNTAGGMWAVLQHAGVSLT